MDRTAALRQIEDALADLEAGETDLAACERQVRTTLAWWIGEAARVLATTGGVSTSI